MDAISKLNNASTNKVRLPFQLSQRRVPIDSLPEGERTRILNETNNFTTKYYRHLRAYLGARSLDGLRGYDESLLRSVEDKIGITDHNRLEFRQQMALFYDNPYNSELITIASQEVVIDLLSDMYFSSRPTSDTPIR